MANILHHGKAGHTTPAFKEKHTWNGLKLKNICKCSGEVHQQTRGNYRIFICLNSSFE